MKKTSRSTRLALTAALALASTPLLATGGGGLAIYPDGLENYMVGALPPPGVHFMVYGGGARYDKLRDNAGNEVPITERAYESPKFVEDLVRYVALRLSADQRIGHFAVDVESFESIHNHSAFARIER